MKERIEVLKKQSLLLKAVLKKLSAEHLEMAKDINTTRLLLDRAEKELGGK